MIRTTLSVCALFGALILACAWVAKVNSSPAGKIPAAAIPAETPHAEKPSEETGKQTSLRTSATLDCVEILPQCGGDCQRERVAPPAYLDGAIPSPHAYMAKQVGYDKPLSLDETDSLFDVDSMNLEAQRFATRTKREEASDDKNSANEEAASEKEPAGESEAAPADEQGKLGTGEEPADQPALSESEANEEKAVSDASTKNETPPQESTASEPAARSSTGSTLDAAAAEIDSLLKELRATKKRPLTPELVELREKLRDCLAYYYHRPENVATRSPWGSMHYMLAYGVDSQLIAGKRQVNACGWLCYNGVCNGQALFTIRDDQLHAKIGPGVQGHPGQFLAMLAQSKVPRDFPLKVEGKDFTVGDLIEHEKLTCKPKTELTFKLIALVHYLKSDDTWESADGETWDIPRLIKEELKQPIIGATCGGSHRLTGFSYALRKREQRKEPITGQWLRAKKFIDDYHDYTFKLQNPDGSFSTNWFAGRADNGPPAKRLETTGHICEWLVFSLPEDDLTDPRLVKSIDYLTDLLIQGRNEKWNIGPLGHGLHALALYDERVFGGKPGQRAVELARQPRLPRITR